MSVDSHLSPSGRLLGPNVTIGALIDMQDGTAARKAKLARLTALERIANGAASYDDVFSYGNRDQCRYVQTRGLAALNKAMISRAQIDAADQF